MSSIHNQLYTNGSLARNQFSSFNDKRRNGDDDKNFRFFISASYDYSKQIWKSGFFKVGQDHWDASKNSDNSFPIEGDGYEYMRIFAKLRSKPIKSRGKRTCSCGHYLSGTCGPLDKTLCYLNQKTLTKVKRDLDITFVKMNLEFILLQFLTWQGKRLDRWPLKISEFKDKLDQSLWSLLVTICSHVNIWIFKNSGII